jgi:ABC-type phosphate transport system substrate-binding protein
MANLWQRIIVTILVGGGVCGAATPAWARRIAVVAGAGSKIGALTEAQARDVFLGNQEVLPSGEHVTPVDQSKDAPITEAFYALVADMSLKDVSVHWAKKVFAGRGTRPVQLEGGDAGVKAWVSARADAIGYVQADAVDGSVKVLLLLER